MSQEAIVLAAIFITGILLMRLAGMRGWGIIPVGFLMGTILFAAAIGIQILLDIPVSYWVPTTLLPVILLAMLILTRGWSLFEIRLGLSRILLYSGILLFCSVVFVVFWKLNIVVFATDTIRQSLASSLIAGGNTEFMSSNLILKRLNTVSMLDALAFLYNSPHIRTLPIFITLATAGSIAWSISHLLKEKLASLRQTAGASLAGVALFASIYSVWWQSFYQGTHVLYGSLLLLAATSGWLLAKKDTAVSSNALTTIIVTSILGLMLSRPESGILVPVALFPLLVHPSISMKIKQVVSISLGFSLLFQQAIILALSSHAGTGLPRNAILLAVASLVLLSLAFFVRLKFTSTRWLQILWAIEVFGWIALMAFALFDSSLIWRSVIGTVKNVVFGQGLWGISYVLLLGLFGLTFLFKKGDKLDTLLRYPITTLLPFGFLVAYLREGGYRAGVYDTFNRMLMHILPILIVYIIYRYYSSIQVQKSRQKPKRH